MKILVLQPSGDQQELEAESVEIGVKKYAGYDLVIILAGEDERSCCGATF